MTNEDCISRNAVNVLVDELDRAICDERCFISRGRSTTDIMQDILDLPSITPKPKTGHWIRHDNGKYHWYLCSCCDAMAGSDEEMMAYKYCPNCGEKKIEPQESENKE